MRQLSIFAAAVILISADAKNVPNPKGPPCPDGDGLYAVGCSSKYLQCVNNVEYEQSCPEGLYFDRLLARCERRSSNHLCATGDRVTLNVRQKAVSINCVGRLSGDYALDKTVCNENYYQCANGISYMRKCPYQQVYVPILKRCDYHTNCNASGGVKDQAAAAYASPTYDSDNYIVTTKEFENGHNGLDCKVTGDMHFTDNVKCSPYFWQCSNGKLFRKTCPEKLIYVLDQNLCDFPESVKDCPEYNGSETSYRAPKTTTSSSSYGSIAEAPVDPTPYAPASAPVYSPPRTTYVPRSTSAAPPNPPPQNPTAAPYVPTEATPSPVFSSTVRYNPAVHGDCKNRDGIFGIKECHASFLSCDNGVGRVIQCADNLVFDTRVSACEFAAICLEPRKPEDVPVLYNHGGAYNERPAEVKVDFDCTGKPNGKYIKEACTKSFFTCHDGRAFANDCPGDLVFNKATGTCDFAENCEKNYMEPSQIYKGEDTPTTTIGYSSSVVYTTTEQPATKPYTQPPRDTERPSTIYGRPIYTKAPTTVGYEQPKATYTTQAPVTTTIALDDFSCKHLADGNHASGLCKSVFYICANGQVVATTCPANLIFNPYVGECDYSTNVRDCQGYQPTTTPSYSYPKTTSKPYEQPSTTQGYAPIEYTPVTPGYAPQYTSTIFTTTLSPKYAAMCAKRDDGNYGFDCEKYLIKCYNRKTFKFPCPSGLYYSRLQDKCDVKENVEGCPEYKPTTDATPAAEQPVISYQNYGYSQSTTKAYNPSVTTPSPQHAAFCERLENGNYGLDCEDYYISCNNFETTINRCPAGLFYSKLNNRCDYKEHVEDCPEYKPTPSTTPAAEQPGTTKYTTYNYPNIDYTSTTPGPVDTTPLAKAFSCSGRPDGIYALPYCSQDYVQCMQGRSLISSCAPGLFYNEKNGMCAYKHTVDTCKIGKGSDIIDSNACFGKSDGYYSAGCSSYYFSCIDEQIRKMSCPNSLKFSKESEKCVFPIDAKECSIATTLDRTPPAVPSDFCTIRSNGLHHLKMCSPHYIVCDNGRAFSGTCIAPLVYNGDTQTCNYKSTNKDCGNDYIPPVAEVTSSYTTYTTKRFEQPAPTTTAAPYQPQTTTTGKVLYKAAYTTTATQYEEPATTPSRDVETPTTTTHKPYETTTEAQDATTTTTASYVAPTTSSAYKSY